jgi:pimeloyl-ACP methyl ester carboxylesterase
VVIPQASHAVVTEQPDLVAQELIKYARGLPPSGK